MSRPGCPRPGEGAISAERLRASARCYWSRLGAAMGLALLAGCASLSPDGGFGDVRQAVTARAGVAAGEAMQWQRSDNAADSVRVRVAELLSQPLGVDDAARIALLNHPGLQAEYAELGIAEAELVQASRWRGPRLSFARLVRGDELEIERGVFFDVLGLLAIPLSHKAQGERFEAAKLRAAGAALRVAQEARRAWIVAVAARQGVTYAAQVTEAADAGAELGRRMAAAGNWSKLAEAREQSFRVEAVALQSRARSAATAATERLARALGLASASAIRMPDRLPDLPGKPDAALPDPFWGLALDDSGELEARALAQRLDVQAARRDAESLARSLGLANATRYIDLVELGYVRKTHAPELPQRGWELDLRLPLFDFGQARTAKAEALYLQAVNRARDTAVRARSEVRETHAALRERYELARHYRDEVLPLRKLVSEEMLLRYNGMLVSVFELLADARAQVASVAAAMDALRDYWLAESDFQMALTAQSGPGAAGPLATAIPNPPASPGAGH
jgi:outer membrane protein TolC